MLQRKQLQNWKGNDVWFDDRKKYLKKRALDIVADQTGKLMDPNVLTIVWARRFAGYKRAELSILWKWLSVWAAAIRLVTKNMINNKVRILQKY